MRKKKFSDKPYAIISLVLFLLLLIAAETPFIRFTPGSFLGAVLNPLSSGVSNAIGVERFGDFALLPLILFFELAFACLAMGCRKLTVAAYACITLALYCVFRFNGVFSIAGYLLFALAVVYFALPLILKTKSRVPEKKKRDSVPDVIDNDDFDSDSDLGNLEIDSVVPGMSREEAMAVLKSVVAPEFEKFPNYTEELLEKKERSFVTGNLFEEESSNLKKKLSEDDNSGFEIENQVEIDIDEPVDSEPVVGPSVVEPVVTEQPVEKFKAVRVRETVSEDTLPPSEEDSLSDEELERTKSKDKDIDFVSGVGGLKRAAGAGYCYDPKKYKYEFPPADMLKHYPASASAVSDISTDLDGRTIVETFAQFKIETKLVGIQHGPTFTLYELALAKGIRVAAILNLADNVAMDLAVQSVRILAPIPGKSAIGVEVPNRKRDTIGFDEMFDELKTKSKKFRIPMVLGKTITGDRIVTDLASAPHMLIAGTTGSGKSVCVNGLISSVLFTKTPREVRMILVDPKMVELTVYNDIPHLLTPVITEPKRAIKAMAFVVQEMERRMALFSKIGARKIEDYNDRIKGKKLLCEPLPYIMVIIDEFADLMMVVGKELESYIKRITAVARFTGIHLVLATQRPSADVITGIIKSNMPTQIAFAVSNQVNSRIILDSIGAEKLLGRGDMLFASASNRTPQRIQGAYIDQEIEQIVSFVKTQGQPDYIDESFFEDPEEEEEVDLFGNVTQGPQGQGEDMFTRAWKIVADRGEASASYIQRRLSIGYNRAANLIEQLEDAGYIGPARGSKPRDILKYPEDNK